MPTCDAAANMVIERDLQITMDDGLSCAPMSIGQRPTPWSP